MNLEPFRPPTAGRLAAFTKTHTNWRDRLVKGRFFSFVPKRVNAEHDTAKFDNVDTPPSVFHFVAGEFPLVPRPGSRLEPGRKLAKGASGFSDFSEMMLDAAGSPVIIGTVGLLHPRASDREGGERAAMACRNEQRSRWLKAISTMCAALATLFVVLALSSEASAGVIVSSRLTSVDGMSAAGSQGDAPQDANPFAQLPPSQKRALLRLFCQGDGPVSTTGAGPSMGVTSSSNVAVAGGSSELPELEPHGYVVGTLTPVLPLPPLFDFLRPPRATCSPNKVCLM